MCFNPNIRLWEFICKLAVLILSFMAGIFPSPWGRTKACFDLAYTLSVRSNIYIFVYISYISYYKWFCAMILYVSWAYSTG